MHKIIRHLLVLSPLLSPLPALAADIDAGQQKYATACAGCHGAKAEGQAMFPGLTEKSADETIAVMQQYKNGETLGASSAMMWGPAKNLSDDEIANIAAYLDSL